MKISLHEIKNKKAITNRLKNEEKIIDSNLKDIKDRLSENIEPSKDILEEKLKEVDENPNLSNYVKEVIKYGSIGIYDNSVFMYNKIKRKRKMKYLKKYKN